MSTPNTPTPGALRAAELIRERSRNAFLGILPPAEALAEVIDRETGSRELLEALKALAGFVETYHNTVDASGYLAAADEAIARVEGR
jgi:hypothetical protein